MNICDLAKANKECWDNHLVNKHGLGIVCNKYAMLDQINNLTYEVKLTNTLVNQQHFICMVIRVLQQRRKHMDVIRIDRLGRTYRTGGGGI